MSLEALWSLQFAGFEGAGGGVVVFETGRVFGGDPSFVWVGEYEVKGKKLTGKIHVKRHNDMAPSILGRDEYDLEVSGDLGESEMELFGSIPDDPQRSRIVILCKRVADLP